MLVVLLRLSAAGTMAAFLAMLLPVDWMEATHARIGLGEFPRLPIMQYLTRSISALYGFHGVFVWIVSTNPVRYRAFVWFTAIMNMVFGAMMLAIDLYAGMPGLWTVIEGPGIMAMGIAIALAARAGAHAS
jgi:hypothetical protein